MAKTVTLWIFLLAVLVPAQRAEAYSYAHKCRGDPANWGQNAGFYAKGAMADATYALAYKAAITEWNLVGGMKDILHNKGGSSGSVKLDNGRNEAGIASAQYMDGYVGMMFPQYTPCNWFYSGEFVEADIRILNTLDWSPPAQERIPSNNAWNTLVHEFGHALGLGHSGRFTRMYYRVDQALHGGTRKVSGPLPDDAAGGRALYRSSYSPRNSFASAQRLDTGGALRNNRASVNPDLCPGDTYSFWVTAGNNGTRNMTVNERFFVKSRKYSTTVDAIFNGYWTNRTFVPGGNYFSSSTLTLSVPSGLTPGATYYVYHQVDADNEYAEKREDDNVVYTGVSFRVRTTGCP